MAVELPPFAVAPEQIARLGDTFTRFVNQLLDIETAAAGMGGVTLTTTYRVNLADGGVDAGIRRAVKTRWLPSGLYVNLTQDHCDGLIRDHLGEEVVAQASS